MLTIKTISAFFIGVVFTTMIVFALAVFDSDTFWVMPLHHGDKPIKELHVLVDNKYFGLDGTAVGSNESTQLIVDIKEPGTYSVIVSFSDGSKLISRPRSVEPGWEIYEHIYNNRIEHDVRIK